MKQVTCERIDDKRIMSAISDFLNNQKLVHTGKRIIEISLSDLESILSAKFYCKLPFDKVKLTSTLNDMIESRNRYTTAIRGTEAIQFKLTEGAPTKIESNERETRIKRKNDNGIRPVFANVINLKNGLINSVNWPASTLFIYNLLGEESLPDLKASIAPYLTGPIKQSEMHKWGEAVPPSVKCLESVVDEKINGSKNIGWINVFPNQKINMSEIALKNIVFISLGGYATVNGVNEKGKFQIPLLDGSLVYLDNIGKMELTGSKVSLWFGLVLSA
jgi:hypothetical protein